MKCFFILEGNNGATYVFNVQDRNAVVFSLKFYKARTIKQKVLKGGLKIFLNSLALLGKASIYSALKDKGEINQYLKKATKVQLDFELDENCSVLISPTRDKIIVHHHGRYFHKFAFGQSYKNVNNEAEIYKLFDKSLHYFEVSRFFDYVDRNNNRCSFKLARQSKSISSDVDITLALVELYNCSQKEGILFSSYLDGLKNRYIKSTVFSESIEKTFIQLEATHKDEELPLGLVHRDFKPWNINDEQGLLIYDFEEAVLDGLPLEDMLNYHIDPIVRYLPSIKVAESIFIISKVNEYKRYLKELRISIDFHVLLYCYLIERIVFWMNAGEQETSIKYCDLLECILTEYKGVET